MGRYDKTRQERFKKILEGLKKGTELKQQGRTTFDRSLEPCIIGSIHVKALLDEKIKSGEPLSQGQKELLKLAPLHFNRSVIQSRNDAVKRLKTGRRISSNQRDALLELLEKKDQWLLGQIPDILAARKNLIKRN